MTKEELAAKLSGREYGSEITGAEADAAKAAGLVVVFGYSDDVTEFAGAINDEVGFGKILLLDGKIFQCDCDCAFAQAARERAESQGSYVTAEWCETKDYSWTYKTEIPHATFDVMEDGEKFCRGIVFSLADAHQ